MVTTRTVQYVDLLPARDNACSAHRYFKSLALQPAPFTSLSLDELYRDSSDSDDFLQLSSQKQGNSCAASVVAGLTPDRPAVRLNDLTAEVQANTGPAPAIGAASAVMLDAKEFLEHPFAKLCGNPWTGICHGNLQEAFTLYGGVLPRCHLDRYRAAARGIRERVRNPA